jgi:hypothetical protein
MNTYLNLRKGYWVGSVGIALALLPSPHPTWADGGSIGTAGGGNLPSAAALIPREIELYWNQALELYDDDGNHLWTTSFRHPQRRLPEILHRNSSFTATFRLQAFGTPPVLESSFSIPDLTRDGARSNSKVKGTLIEARGWFGGQELSFPAFTRRMANLKTQLLALVPENPLDDLELIRYYILVDEKLYFPLYRFLASENLTRSGLSRCTLDRVDPTYQPLLLEATLRLRRFLNRQIADTESQISQVLDREGRCSLARYHRLEAQFQRFANWRSKLGSRVSRTSEVAGIDDPFLREEMRCQSWDRQGPCTRFSRWLLVEAQIAEIAELQAFFDNTLKRACSATVDPAAPIPPPGLRFEEEAR